MARVGVLCVLLLTACGGAPERAAVGSATHVDRSASGEASAVANPEEKRVVCDRLVDDFSGSELGRFPTGWRARDDEHADLVQDEPLYVVEEDGDGRALHGTFLKETVTIVRLMKDWNLEEYPILQWRWRAVTLPTGGDETDASKNDTGAAVYAVWRAGFPFQIKGIKYAWSTTLPVGTRYSKRFGHDQLLVVESGPKPDWRTVRMNVREHYKELFEEDEAPSPEAIAVMTDADTTETRAEAYFADFRLCRFDG